MGLVLTSAQLATFDFSRGVGAVHTPSSEDLKATLADLSKVLGSALVTGGVAVVHYGYERSTKDIDVLYANHDEYDLLRRLKKDFKLVRKSTSGWHHFDHRKTKVRLELIPEGAVGTYGFIPGPKTVGGDSGFISLLGLVWLKLVAGRGRDIADMIDLAKLRMEEMVALQDRLPPENRERFAEVLAQARKEMAFDPGRLPDDSTLDNHPVEESKSSYGNKKRAVRKPAKKKR